MVKIIQDDNLTDENVLDVLRGAYKQIYAAERKVADYILANPQRASQMNVSEIASQSGASDATVTRLCQHIGYTGFNQMRLCLARDVALTLNTNQDAFTKKDTVTNFFSAYAENMKEIGRHNSDEQMLKIASVIKSCKIVHIIGLGNSNTLAEYAAFLLERIGIRCTTGTSPEFFMNHVNLADPQDAVIAITKSGASKQVVSAVQLAKKKGCVCIAITEHSISPTSRLADYVILAKGNDDLRPPILEHSNINMTAAVDILTYFVRNEAHMRQEDADRPEMILSDLKV